MAAKEKYLVINPINVDGKLIPKGSKIEIYAKGSTFFKMNIVYDSLGFQIAVVNDKVLAVIKKNLKLIPF